MDKLKKCGEMYIKFDKFNEPEYGFIVDGKDIIQYVNLSEKDHERIILPSLVESKKYSQPTIVLNREESFYARRYIKKYIRESVTLCEGCFGGVKKAELIIPFENSIIFNAKSFNEIAEIGFIAPENFDVKKIISSCYNGFEMERDEWLVLGDKTLSGEFSLGGYNYSVHEYDPYSETVDFYVVNEKQENSENEK